MVGSWIMCTQNAITATPGTKIDSKCPQPLYHFAIAALYCSRNVTCFSDMAVVLTLLSSVWSIGLGSYLSGRPSNQSLIAIMS